jgi:hypothetical protein
MMPTPEAASPLPLKVAPLADRPSRFRGGHSIDIRLTQGATPWKH